MVVAVGAAGDEQRWREASGCEAATAQGACVGGVWRKKKKEKKKSKKEKEKEKKENERKKKKKMENK